MSTQSTEVTTTVPAGYRMDAEGRLVPESLIKPIDRTRDQLVQELIEGARKHADALTGFKAKAFEEIAAFVSLSAGEYNVKIGGKKGNVTLVSYDGRYKVVRQVAETLVFDERLQVAKELIDSCIQRWSPGSRPEIQALINDAFQVNKKGQINTARVLGLKKLDIRDPQWLQAMEAVSDSIHSSASKAYVRFYERVGDTDEYRPISLDVATA